MDANQDAQIVNYFREFMKLVEAYQGQIDAMWLISDKYDSEDDLPAEDSFTVRVMYENANRLYHIDVIDQSDIVNAYTVGPTFSLADLYAAYNHTQRPVAYMDITTSAAPGIRYLTFTR